MLLSDTAVTSQYSSTQTHRRTAPCQGSFSTVRRVLGKRCTATSNDDDMPSVSGDWREFRANLISKSGTSTDEDNLWAARVTEENMKVLRSQDVKLAQEPVWAHATPGNLEPGGLLLATAGGPELLKHPVYWQMVVLLTSHGPSGSVGLILNCPCQAHIGDLAWPDKVSAGNADAFRMVKGVFADSRIYLGGVFAPNRVSRQVMSMLHGYRDIPEAEEIIPGVYLGGLSGAAEAVLNGKASTNGFRFFAGIMVWPPGGLAVEVASEAWYTAACSRSLVLKQCLSLPVPLWREIMELMGGKYKMLAVAASPRERQQ